MRGCCCVLPEGEGSDAWSSRTNLCGGLEGVAGRCRSSSLSLDGRGLGVFVCGWGLVARGAVVAERSALEGRWSGMGSLGLGMLRLLLLVLRCFVGVGWGVYPSRPIVECGWFGGLRVMVAWAVLRSEIVGGICR